MAIAWHLLLLSVSLWDYYYYYFIVFFTLFTKFVQIACSWPSSLFYLHAFCSLPRMDGSYLSLLILVTGHISNAIQKRNLLSWKL